MLKVRQGAVIALLVAATAVSACRRSGTTEEKPAGETPAAAGTKPAEAPAPPQAPPPPPKPVPATLPDVIARVNGQEVRKAEFDRLLRQIEAENGRAVPDDRRDEIYRNIIEELVTYTVLVQETKARNITVSEAEAKQVADARIAELRKQVPDEAAFNKALNERGMTVARLRSDIRQQMAISKMIQEELAKQPPPSEADLKEYYDKNPDEFKGVRASHILIRPDGFDEPSRQKARAAIDEVLKQAKAGADFGELAKKHSSDGSAQAGGDLGFFTRPQMVPEFSQAAFSLQPGEISDVVETQFGYHIIKVTERKEVQFSEATEKLRAFISQRQREEAQEAFIKGLKDRARIEVLV